MKKLLLILSLILVAGTLAADDDDHIIARELLLSGKILSLEQILEKLRPEHPEARILEVELEQKDERIVYEIELLDSEGVVWELYLDAADGKVLSREQEE